MAKQTIPENHFRATVEEFIADGILEVTKINDVYLHTHCGYARVGYIRNPDTDPWVVCPDENAGFGLSYAVHYGTLLYMVPKA